MNEHQSVNGRNGGFQLCVRVFGLGIFRQDEFTERKEESGFVRLSKSIHIKDSWRLRSCG